MLPNKRCSLHTSWSKNVDQIFSRSNVASASAGSGMNIVLVDCSHRRFWDFEVSAYPERIKEQPWNVKYSSRTVARKDNQTLPILFYKLLGLHGCLVNTDCRGEWKICARNPKLSECDYSNKRCCKCVIWMFENATLTINEIYGAVYFTGLQCTM